MNVIFNTLDEIIDSVLSSKGKHGSLRYVEGEFEAHYPVPVTWVDNEIAINWTAIEFCQCPTCAENFMDGLVFVLDIDRDIFSEKEFWIG